MRLATLPKQSLPEPSHSDIQLVSQSPKVLHHACAHSGGGTADQGGCDKQQENGPSSKQRHRQSAQSSRGRTDVIPVDEGEEAGEK